MNEACPRVLIVDDEKFQRVVLESYITKFGYRACIVSSGTEALEMCETITPDLILLDVMMPNMNGIEACEKLKRIPTLADVPIVMLTGKKDPSSIRHSFEVGASDFLTKPINEILLKKRIEYAIHNNKVFQKLKDREKELIDAQKIAKLGTIKININDRSIEISSNYHDILGLDKKKEIFSYAEFLCHVHLDDITHVYFTLEQAIKNHEHYMLEYRFISNNNREFIIFQQGEYIESDEENQASCLLGSFQDVTESRTAKEILDYSRYYDPLTDLTNRSFFETQIKHILKHPPKDSLFSVVFVGLDNFSRVNDEYGHKGGDLILKDISDRLIGYEDKGYIISRFGGDVFTLLIKNIHHIDECSKIMDELLEKIKQPLIINNNEVYVTASIGISVFPLESEQEMHLLIGAEAAMMLSREEGGDRYTYRTHRMNMETQDKLALLKEMRIALDNNEFIVYYQPQIDSNNMNIVGMEALARWKNSEKGLISPADFIPVAEESGLIIPLGDYILHQACKQTKKWIDMGFDLNVGVNISAHQFETEDFIQKIESTLLKTGLAANKLEIEITESIAMKDHDTTIKKLAELRKLGVKTSMDDFGTGYSSLSQLQTIPLDTLKVDQAFVKCIKLEEDKKKETDRTSKCYENSAIANAIIVMSHSLGLKVIAEGVETADQCRFLQEQKSEILQGYLFSKPLPAEELETMLIQQKQNMESGWLKYIGNTI